MHNLPYPTATQLSFFMASARFEKSAAHPQQLPPAKHPEVAFVGRSNVGKSSAINTLTSRAHLARVSRKPGRTQLINFFRLPNGSALIDLPGYGYAAVPEEIRRNWAPLLKAYLGQRTALVGLVVVMDARRPFTPLDQQLLRWVAPRHLPVFCLLTKADKLPRHEQHQTLHRAKLQAAQFPLDIDVQLFSSLKKNGVETLIQGLVPWLKAVEWIHYPGKNEAL